MMVSCYSIIFASYDLCNVSELSVPAMIQYYGLSTIL